jgi:hypothetical protein
MRANQRLCAIGEADQRARFTRYGAIRLTMTPNSIVDQQAKENKLGFVSHL